LADQASIHKLQEKHIGSIVTQTIYLSKHFQLKFWDIDIKSIALLKKYNNTINNNNNINKNNDDDDDDHKDKEKHCSEM